MDKSNAKDKCKESISKKNKIKSRGVKNMKNAAQPSPSTSIKATPVVEGKFAQEIITEVMSKPSKKAIIRNKKASDLVKKLRG